MAIVMEDLTQDIPIASITSIPPMHEVVAESKLKEKQPFRIMQDSSNLNLSMPNNNNKFINKFMALERREEGVMMLPQKVLRVWSL